MIHPRSLTLQASTGRTLARFALWLLAILLALPAGSLAQSIFDNVPHVSNGAAPAGGLQTLQLAEIWRIGGEDEGVVLGRITRALTDGDGNLYLLDGQQTQVHVFSPAGKYLRSLSREGEGPGEVGSAADMLWMPDGTLGIVQGFPAKIVKLDRDGTPKGELAGGGQDPAAGGFYAVRNALSRAGIFAVSGEQMSRTDEGFAREKFLAVWNADGSEKCRLIERQAPAFTNPPKYIEREEFFPDAGRWDIAPDGGVYAASEYQAYSILVFGADGQPARVIDRTFESWKRTEAEKEDVGSGMRIVADGHEVKIERTIEERDPCIRGLRVTAAGELWVLSSRGVREQPPGTLQTYDVFDRNGHFVRQVAIACEGDPLHDALIFVDDAHAVLVRGLGAGPDGSPGAEGEQPSMEVVYYRVTG
jgi:hypothetical protein